MKIRGVSVFEHIVPETEEDPERTEYHLSVDGWSHGYHVVMDEVQLLSLIKQARALTDPPKTREICGMDIGLCGEQGARCGEIYCSYVPF